MEMNVHCNWSSFCRVYCVIELPFSIHEEPVPTIIDPTTQNMNAPPGLPPKPTSRQEQNRKRNYFPISWRVIGGGVLIGDPNRKPALAAFPGHFTPLSTDTSPVDGDSGSTKWPENAEGDYTERRSNEHCNDFVPDEVNSGGSPPAAGYPDLKPLRRPRSTSISRPSQVKLRSVRFPSWTQAYGAQYGCSYSLLNRRAAFEFF